MKYLKGGLLLMLLMIMGWIFLGMEDVKAAGQDFFKEYTSADSFVEKEYNFRLKYKCRLTIYMVGQEPDDYDDDYDYDYDDDYDYDLYGMYVAIDGDEDGFSDDVFEKYIDATDSYQKTITLAAGKYSLYVDSDGPYYISLSGEYYPELSSKDITLEEGKSKTLKVNGTSSNVKWSSSKKSVATVSNKGVVRAKKAGKAVITAKCGKHSLKCKVTVKKKPVPYKGIANKLKSFAKKNKNYKFKNIDVGKKCRLYGYGISSYTSESVMYDEGYGLTAVYYPYIELVKKSNGKSEIRFRIYGEMYELSLYSSTSLHSSSIQAYTSNRRMKFKMENTYNRNVYKYSGRYYEGRMKGYAQISSSSNPMETNIKKFDTMLGQNSLSMKLNSSDGAYFKLGIPAANRKNWRKLLKEYNMLLKEY